MGQRAHRTGGRKIDTWEVRFPNDVCAQVDIYMHRNPESEYTFSCKLERGKTHPFDAEFHARTPTELRDMLNLATTEHIERTWKKQLMVEFDSYRNDEADPEAPGVHELRVDWQIVHVHGQGKNRLYLHDGELCSRDCRFGRRESAMFLDWTQKREDVLRGLGAAIHQAHTRLAELVNEDKLGAALDNAGSGQRLLTENGSK
jgi:hypothetical protein